MSPPIPRWLVIPAFLLILAIPLTSARDVELEITSPADGRVFVTNGAISITFRVENIFEARNPADPDGTASSVTLSASKEGLSFSSGSANIKPGEASEIVLTITGFVWERTSVRVTATGTNPNYDVDGDTVTIVLIPPKIGLDILSPEREVKLVDFQSGGTYTFTALLKNTGEVMLQGVAPEATSQKMDCWASTGAQNIEAGKTASYSFSCNNVSTGNTVKIKFKDANNAISKMRDVTFTLTESFKLSSLNITEPTENEEIRIPPEGGAIQVKVLNSGEKDLTGVCLSAEGLVASVGNCVNLTVGSEHTFDLQITPTKFITNVRIMAMDDKGTSDEVTIRAIRVESVPPPILPQSGGNNTSETPNITASDFKPVGGEDSDKSFFGLSIEMMLIIMVILLVLIIIGVVVNAKGRGK